MKITILLTTAVVAGALAASAAEPPLVEYETGYDLALALPELERINPTAYRVLRDGTFDTMHPDEKIAFAAERFLETAKVNPLVAATDVAGAMVRDLQNVREGLDPKAQAIMDQAITRGLLGLIEASERQAMMMREAMAAETPAEHAQ